MDYSAPFVVAVRFIIGPSLKIGTNGQIRKRNPMKTARLVGMMGEYNMKDRKENYVIFSRSESEIPGGVMYWSNGDGWTNYINSTRFSRREKQGFYLPMSKDNDAAWVRVCPEREE